VNVIDKAIDAVFDSDLLGCERGLDLNRDIAVIQCQCYDNIGTIDVRKLVTLVLQQAGVDVTPNKDAEEFLDEAAARAYLKMIDVTPNKEE
jgi:hypothetical protein